MKILILGCDGYLGYSLSQYLHARGCTIIGIDNLSRRRLVREVGGESLTPDLPVFQKRHLWSEFYYKDMIEVIRPVLQVHGNDLDAIIHLAEQPSAPYSMIGPKEARDTIQNNVEGTMELLFAMRDFAPQAHLVKLGTMGEYGTPGIKITEGPMRIEVGKGYVELPFPKQPGSIYHATKVMDTALIQMLCRIWGLKATDIMQGVVYGVAIDENKDQAERWTRFDYDGVFGTAINRFVVQAICEHPLTVYGEGGQTRGFLDIRDSMDCLWLSIQNPPEQGQYRVFNQLEDVYSIHELAETVCRVATQIFNINCQVEHINNPRVEMEKHFYEVESEKLRELGYKPRNLEKGIELLFSCLLRYSDRIKTEHFVPRVNWKDGYKRDFLYEGKIGEEEGSGIG